MRELPERSTAGVTRRSMFYSCLPARGRPLCVALVLVLVSAGSAAASAPAPVAVGEILAAYNAGIVRERALIESLSVLQTMIDPQEDGSEKRSEAMLVYTADGGMERRVIFSETSYPAGDYTLESLIGPELHDDEYRIEYAGIDTVDGEAAHRLLVEAIVRDSRHFDGDIWIAESDLTPVRVAGQVADPPFPVVLITLDKRFGRGPDGIRLLRRHSGEAEVNLLLGRKRGVRHIFYDDYVVRARVED